MPAKAGIFCRVAQGDARFRGHDGVIVRADRMQKGGWIYIMTNRRDGVLYIGVTSDLIVRTSQHRAGKTKGFTQRYRLKLLVYYERYEDITDAIIREKVLKKWRRAWKLALIETMKPEWHDLYESIL